MTDYIKVMSSQTEKPLELDATSSKFVVYQRKNITFVEEVTGESEQETVPAHWEYEERKMTKSEYSQYVIAMEQAAEINNHSDQEAIDRYTLQLMEEGVL